MTPDPREDALAKAREALTYALHEFTAMRHYAARDVVEPALAALSAPPSQSESDDEKRLRSVLSVALDALRMHVNRDPKAMEATHDALGYAEQEFG